MGRVLGFVEVGGLSRHPWDYDSAGDEGFVGGSVGLLWGWGD